MAAIRAHVLVVATTGKRTQHELSARETRRPVLAVNKTILVSMASEINASYQFSNE